MKKQKKQNNKGFSLVELIIAIAILSVVIVPVLHAMYTSLVVNTKAKKTNEISQITQNIMEVVQTYSHDKVVSATDTDVLKMLKCVNINGMTPFENDNSRVAIRNIASQTTNNKYDAVIHYSSGDTGSLVKQLNETELAKFTSLDGTFAEPEGSNSPDALADADFVQKARINGTYTDKKRIIKINITGENVSNGTADNIDIDVTYYYTYTYQKQKTNQYGEIVEGESVTAKINIEYTYFIFRNGYQPISADDIPSVYVIYYPDYEQNTDTIEIYNRQDINVNLFIVKNGSKLKAENKTEPVTYKAEINQYFSSKYNLTDDSKKALYTNAGINIDTDEVLTGFTYRIFRNNLWYVTAKNRVDGSLVSTEKKDHIWTVTVELYPAGTVTTKSVTDADTNVTKIYANAIPSGTQPVGTLEGTKLG